MAARIIAGTLGGAMSAFAIVKSTTVTANQTDKKALTTIFYHEDNAVATQDVQLTKATHTPASKPASHANFPVMEEPRTAPIATRHLILVRHGQEENSQNESAGLTVMGREQASLAGKRLVEMDLPVTKIVHNGQRRAVETSNMIASYLPDTRREADSSLKNTESLEDAVQKYLSVAPLKQTGDSYVVVVCDEDMIKRLVSRAMNLNTADQTLKLQLHHASVSMLAVHPNGQVTVRALGDTGYMSKDHFTTNRL